MAGVGGTGRNDSGVAARLFGTLLTWLSDHTSDVMIVATANNIAALPPEFTRAERFDGVFFMDLPTDKDKELIWSMYVEKYRLRKDQVKERPPGYDWTGAEIAACCRLASLLDSTLMDAAQNIVPVAHTAAEQIAALRATANGKYLSANRPGTYDSTEAETERNGTSNGSVSTGRRLIRPRKPDSN